MRPLIALCAAIALLIVAAPASAAPVIGSVTPTIATANTPVTLQATVSSGMAIERCTLWADLAEIGDMTVANGKATRSHTFTSGGSHIAFVFCRDTQGGMASGVTTGISVSGQIVEQAPLQLPPSNPGSSPAPAEETTPMEEESPDVMEEGELTPEELPAEPSPYSGKLLKAICPEGADMNHFCRAVYYIGKDGKRHAFPSARVFFTWYQNFASVEEVSVDTLSAISLGANVHYRAGVRMVKFTTDPKVYAVSKNGLLRWIQTEDLARTYYGTEWNRQIDDMPDSFYADYTFGEDVDEVADYNPEAEFNNSKE